VLIPNPRAMRARSPLLDDQRTDALTKIVLAIITAIQLISLAYITMISTRTQNQITSGQEKTATAINVLEQKINSNMERQILSAINEAIAREQVRVLKLQKEGPRGEPGPPGPQGVPGRPQLRLPNQLGTPPPTPNAD